VPLGRFPVMERRQMVSRFWARKTTMVPRGLWHVDKIFIMLNLLSFLTSRHGDPCHVSRERWKSSEWSCCHRIRVNRSSVVGLSSLSAESRCCVLVWPRDGGRLVLTWCPEPFLSWNRKQKVPACCGDLSVTSNKTILKSTMRSEFPDSF
jgi:hypothetical protein